MRTLPAILLFAIVAIPAQAQEDAMELLRSDLRANKLSIVTSAMGLTAEQHGLFWPVYKEYEAELAKIGDDKIAIIEEYVASYSDMGDEQAKALMDRAFKVEDRTIKLRKKYFKNLQKVLPASVAARAVQLENQIGRLIDAQIGSQLPLAGMGASVTDP
jgi:hypothetical protein